MSKGRTKVESLQEYARGVSGGLIFSLPLLFTMEVWWAGFTAHPVYLLLYVFFTFLMLLGYNYFAGIRHDTCFEEVIIDSVEEMGIGIIMSAVTLWVLNRITINMDPLEIAGKVIIEGMLVAIGVSIGTSQLGDDDEKDVQDKGVGSKGNSNRPSIQMQVVLAICGSVIFAANVAPTEEVMILGIEITAFKLILIVLLSLGFSSVILYFSGFKGSIKHSIKDELFHIVGGSLMSYTVALIVSGLILWFYGRMEDVSFFSAVAQIIILGIPASLGSSAGRLLFK